MTGRIIKAISGFYDVETPEGTLTCRARGKFRKDGLTPLVGDMAQVERDTITAILPRKNSFLRPAVANVDLLVVFASDVIPVTEPYLIDRILAIAGSRGAETLVAVNKSDLAPHSELAAIYKRAGIPVLCTSSVTGEGIDALRSAVAGKFAVFTGNSGVGKSSVLNRLDAQLCLPTGEVSQKLGRGRHTTRHIEIYRLPDGTQIADTPGFSAFDTDRMDLVVQDDLLASFPDFAPYLGKCRFPDCAHIAEPDCAVREALDAGKLEPTRYDSYCRLYRQAKSLHEWE